MAEHALPHTKEMTISAEFGADWIKRFRAAGGGIYSSGWHNPHITCNTDATDALAMVADLRCTATREAVLASLAEIERAEKINELLEQQAAEPGERPIGDDVALGAWAMAMALRSLAPARLAKLGVSKGGNA